MPGSAQPEPNALASAGSLVLLQAGSRLSTFVLNQALVRVATPAAYGVAAIQFELLSSTMLFLAREGIRSAVLRAPPPASPANAQKLVNVTRIPFLVGPLVTAAILGVYYTLTGTETTHMSGFTRALAVYIFAALVELRTEPAHLAALRARGVGLRVKAEGWGVAARSVVTFVLLAIFRWELSAFAVGQLAYAVAVLFVYSRAPEWTTWKVHSVNSEEKTKEYFDQDALRLSGEMTAQSLVKHFLTEGDKFMLSVFAPLKDQGGYALASNYGALFARIIFQPLEETARLLFSRTLGSGTPPSPGPLKRAASFLSALLLLYAHFALVLIAFAPPFLPLATALLLPYRFRTSTSAPRILRAFIYTLPVMAANGALEALVASAAKPVALRKQSGWMAFCSLAFVCFTVFLRGLVDEGTEVVWANAFALALRAAWAARFARDLLGPEFRWRYALPKIPVMLAFAFAGWLVRLSAGGESIKEQIRHVSIGVLCLAMCLVICILFEEDTLRHAVPLFRRRRE
ncbi:Rft-1-domain-containing protein [Auricularia subglabra TFB-10046 SS5]|nr:Rft-1-domain-containing protein [Auricularia subglabra TFB-10046 SS5]